MKIFKSFLIFILLIFIISPSLTNAECINLNKTLRRGMRDTFEGGPVSLLQDFLYEKGFLNDTNRGFYGSKTRQAVKELQTKLNITSSGTVGLLTRRAINNISCGNQSFDNINNNNNNNNNNNVYGPISGAEYRTSALPTGEAVSGYNVVYRYSITAPSTNPISLTGDSIRLSINGVKATEAKMQVFRSFYNNNDLVTESVTNINSDNNTNITNTYGFTLNNTISIPAGETRYVQFIVYLDNSNNGGSISASKTNLGTQTLNITSFTSNGTIVLTTPNGGEKLIKGKEYSIRWSATRLGTIRIRLIDISGNQIAITDAVDSSKGEYLWTVPSNLVTANGYKIILGVTGTTDRSNDVFSIVDATPTITLTSPNTATWNMDSNIYQDITWTTESVSNNAVAQVYLLFPNNSRCNIANVLASNSKYSLLPKNIICLNNTNLKVISQNGYKIGVSVLDSAGQVFKDDQSNSTINIISNSIDPANMKLVTPNGGENFTATQVQNITWTTPTALTSSANIDLRLAIYDTNGNYKNTIAIANVKNTKTYTWTIPNNLSDSDKYKIEISSTPSGTYTDLSDNFFNIKSLKRTVNLSTDKISYLRGSIARVSWNPTGFLGNEKAYIHLYNQSGALATNLYTQININEGYKDIIIPANLNAGNYKYKISPINYTFDTNSIIEKGFTVTGESRMLILSNTSTTIERGTNINLSWTKTDFVSIDRIKVDLYNSSGVFVSTLAQNINPNTENGISVNIPSAVTPGNYTLKISPNTQFNFGTGSVLNTGIISITARVNAIIQINQNINTDIYKGDNLSLNISQDGITSTNLTIELLNIVNNTENIINTINIPKNNLTATLLMLNTYTNGQYKIRVKGYVDNTLITANSNTFTLRPKSDLITKVITFNALTSNSFERGASIPLTYNKTLFDSVDKMSLYLVNSSTNSRLLLSSNIIPSTGIANVSIPANTVIGKYKFAFTGNNFSLGSTSVATSTEFNIINKTGSININNISTNINTNENLVINWSSIGLLGTYINVALVKTNNGVVVATSTNVNLLKTVNTHTFAIPLDFATGTYKVAISGINDAGSYVVFSNEFTISKKIYAVNILSVGPVNKGGNTTITWNTQNINTSDIIEIFLIDRLNRALGSITNKAAAGDGIITISVPNSTAHPIGPGTLQLRIPAVGNRPFVSTSTNIVIN